MGDDGGEINTGWQCRVVVGLCGLSRSLALGTTGT